MSNENDTLGEQPASQSTPANGAQPAAADISTAIASLDEASLSQALGFSDTPVAATPTPEADEATEPEEREQPPEEPQAEETPDSKPKGRLSVRALPADEQKQLAVALEMVREGQAPSVYAALQSLAGPVTEATPENPQATPAPSPAAPPPTPPAVAEIENRIAELRAERKAAKLDFDGSLESELTDQIEDTIAELSAARANAVLQQQAQGAWQADYISSVDAMEAKYPDAADDTTTFYQLLDDKVLAAETRKDPALNDPNYILKFADEVAQVLKTPGSKPPAPPVRVKSPIGASVAPSQSTSVRPSADQLRDLIKNASPEELGAVIFDH